MVGRQPIVDLVGIVSIIYGQGSVVSKVPGFKFHWEHDTFTLRYHIQSLIHQNKPNTLARDATMLVNKYLLLGRPTLELRSNVLHVYIVGCCRCGSVVRSRVSGAPEEGHTVVDTSPHELPQTRLHRRPNLDRDLRGYLR